MSAKEIMFFTDPHVGKTLVSNTTPASRKRLSSKFAEIPLALIKAHRGPVVCGGDLFDKFDNAASVVRDGARIASRCDLVLGGNHDVENSIDSYSSLGLVADLTGNTVVMPQYDKVTIDVRDLSGGVTIVSVPHHSTQQLFNEALAKASLIAKGSLSILLLHCNYNCDMATNDTSLNLTRDVAAKLLETFDRIFIGHDHNAKKDFDDRLIVMGSVFPTCFGDCHVDHKVYYFNSADNSVSEEVVWSAADKYLETDVDAITQMGVMPDVDFVRITGRMMPEQTQDVARWVKEMWKKGEDSPFAIRIDATVVANKQELITESAEVRLSFKERIEQQLISSPDLLEIWKSVTSEEESI